MIHVDLTGAAPFFGAHTPDYAAEAVERIGIGALWVRLAAALCGRTNA